VSVLESDPRVQVSKCDLKLSALERALAECAARLVILDWPLDLGVVTSLRLLRPGVDVVVFAPAPTHAFGVLVLAAGASCVSSMVPREELLDIVHRPCGKEPVFTFRNGRGVERIYASDMAPLTIRELEILHYLGLGAADAGIAYALRISVRTVETHVRRVREKLGVSDRHELRGCRLCAGGAHPSG
jgi:DNA-binding NarL/FixJ family response regulator